MRRVLREAAFLLLAALVLTAVFLWLLDPSLGFD